MEGIDGRIAELASRQHSLVTLRQLRDIGVTRKQLRVRLGRGQWSKLDRFVVRIDGAPPTWRSQLLAAVLSGGPSAVASHRAAATLWGLDLPHRPKLELTLPRGHHFRRPPGVVVHHSSDLDRVTPVDVDGIPTTPVNRTLLDLGAVLPAERVHIAIDSARRLRLTDWNALLDTLVDHARRGRDGVGPLRSILDEHFGEGAVADSGFERLVLAAIREWGLPTPVFQHELLIGQQRYRLDLAYPTKRICIELDGSIHRRRDVWRADHQRQNALVNAGWHVLRYTWDDYRNHSGRMYTEIKAALNQTVAAGGP